MARSSSPKSLKNVDSSLTDRVRERVAEASHALDQGKRNKPGKRQSRLDAFTGSARSNSEESRERRSLRRVYYELRGTYRRHRRESGQPAVPQLREAVHAFKRGPSLTSLVSVAAFLDERGLLAW